MRLIEIATTRLAAVGKNEKMEVLYRYLPGSEFKQRVEAIVEAFVAYRRSGARPNANGDLCITASGMIL